MTEPRDKFNSAPKTTCGLLSWQVMDALILIRREACGRGRHGASINLSTAEARALRAWLDIAIPKNEAAEQEARAHYSPQETRDGVSTTGVTQR